MIFQTETRQIADVTVVSMSGRIALGNTLLEAENAIKSLIEAGKKKVILDLTNVASMDSAGIGLLVSCSGAMGRTGGKLAVAGANQKVNEIFEVTRVHQVISIYPDIDSARNALA